MRHVLLVSLAVGLTATWLGCQRAADSKVSTTAAPTATAPSTPSEPESDATATQLVQVTLKVPNMTWGGCAASVRGALEKVDGITEIETDPVNRVCRFKVTKPDLDYQSRLAELAITNDHLAGYEVQ